MLCESCARPVPRDDYDYLAENTVYDLPLVYIFHQDCDANDGYKIVETYETCGELKIVRIEEL